MQTPPLVSNSRFLIGHALEFSKNSVQLFKRGYSEHGKIFSIRIGKTTCAVFADPELASFLYKETDHSLNIEKPLKFLRRALGEVSFLAGPEKYKLQRPMQMALFTSEKLKNYTQIMHQIVQKRLDALPEQGTFEVTSETKDLTQEVIGRCILGNEIHDKLGGEFWKHFIRIGESLDPIIPSNLPLPKFIKRNKSRKAIKKMLQPIIKERRSNPDNYDDVLQDIVSTPLLDGTLPNNELIVSMVMALLFAGYETTAGQAAWTVIQILQHSWYQNLLNEEIKEKLPYINENQTLDLLKLKHVRWAVDETTRLKPSAHVSIRLAINDIEVEGFHISKNTPIFLATEKVQTLSEIFNNAEQYDPLRFASGRSEHKKVKHCITGFGGGMHKCLGMGFAISEMNIYTSLIFQQFELELVTKETHTVSGLGTKKPSETIIKYKRRSIETRTSTSNNLEKCPFN